MSDSGKAQSITTKKTIAELDPYDKKIDVIFKVISKESPREITSRRTGETNTVCDVIVSDITASIILTLWNEDIDAVTKDSTYKIANGYITIFNDSMRLAKGRYGELNKVDPSEEIGEVKLDYNRSSEIHPRRSRPRRSESRLNFGGGRYQRRNRGGDRRRSRRRRYDRW
ncbi:MAG: single-stranded DNA-binding protein [Candidatus Heimdallarchaeota archaeon]